MSKDYKNEINELKKNIEIMDGTFEQYGLEIMNVGFQFNEKYGNEYVEVFFELVSKDKPQIEEQFPIIKVNLYDSDNSLLGMNQRMINLEKFPGYDTYKIELEGKNLFCTAKARFYVTR